MLRSPERPDPLLGRTLDGRVRLREVLGSGGMGTVYAAVQLELEREVAVKVLRPGVVDESFRHRFKLEARATSKLNHPNIVTVHDFGIDGDVPYLVLERLHGHSLRAALRDGPLPQERARAVLHDVAAALAAAHAAGVVHRDLKPDNIFLHRRADGSEVVKVVDFGIARILDTDGNATVTDSGAVAGTAGYVAPERMLGKGDDGRGDLYSLGVVAWELLAGRQPFSGDTPMALALAHLTTPAPSLSSTTTASPTLVHLVDGLLAKDPALRPQSADAVARALALPGPGSSPTALQVTAPPPARRSTWSALFAIEFVALALVLLVVLAVFRPWRPAEQTPQTPQTTTTTTATTATTATTTPTTPDATKPGAQTAEQAWSEARAAAADAGYTIQSDVPLCVVHRFADIASCTEQARVALYGADERAAVQGLVALQNLCRDGQSRLACFHWKVVEGAGTGDSANPVGAIDVDADERAAADADCAAGSAVACYALSIVREREARTRGDDPKPISATWLDFCARGIDDACSRSRIVRTEAVLP